MTRHNGTGELVWAALTGAAVVAVTVARVPSAWTTVWAEDGKVFLAGAVSHGFASLGQFYAGYLNTVPRLGALIAAALPLSAAAFVMATYAVLVVALCASIVEASSGAYIGHRWIRVGLGLSFGFLPAIRVESIANMANLQFFLVAASFWLLLTAPANRTGRCLTALFLVATAMSTLVGFLLMPLALARLAKRSARVLAAVFIVAQIAHGVVVLIVRPPRHVGGAAGAPLARVLAHFIVDVLAGDFFGGPFAHLRDGRLTLLILAAAGAGCALWLFIHRAGDGQRLAVAAGAIVLALAGYLAETATGGLTFRYAVLPAFLVLFGVAIAADIAWRLGVTRAVTLVTVAAVVLSWGSSFAVVTSRVDGPRWANVYAAAQRTCRHRPGAVRLPVLPRGWSLSLPCAVLR